MEASHKLNFTTMTSSRPKTYSTRTGISLRKYLNSKVHCLATRPSRISRTSRWILIWMQVRFFSRTSQCSRWLDAPTCRCSNSMTFCLACNKLIKLRTNLVHNSQRCPWTPTQFLGTSKTTWCLLTMAFRRVISRVAWIRNTNLTDVKPRGDIHSQRCPIRLSQPTRMGETSKTKARWGWWVFLRPVRHQL